MDDIAKDAGLSKTTLYTIFNCKEDLELLVYQKIHKLKMVYLEGMADGTFRTDLDPNGTLDTLYLSLRATLNQTILYNPIPRWRPISVNLTESIRHWSTFF